MDQDGFERVYAQTAEPLRKYVIHVVGSVSTADDIVQDTYMRFVRRPPDGGHPRQVRAYLFTIATNLIRDHWRERRHDPMVPVPLDAPASTRDYSLRLDMDHALRRLRPRERQLVWLAHVEGVDHRAIAKMTGLKHKSVRVLLFRARQALAKHLRDAGYSAKGTNVGSGAGSRRS